MSAVLRVILITLSLFASLDLSRAQLPTQQTPASKALPQKAVPGKQPTVKPKGIAKSPALKTLVEKPLARGAIAKFNVKGNKKIEADAILARLKSKVGESLNRETIREDVQSIYGMGYFYNVEVSQETVGAGLELT